jgi:carbon-monoxide dehydrogenase small subunit
LTSEVLNLRVNGQTHQVLAPLHHTLLEVLREEMDLTGTKHGCELGECGACTVLIDGVPTLSCLTLPIEVQGPDITTVEGLATGSEMHPLQVAFAENGAAQCGYCTPGILMSATALLDRTLDPTEADVRQALAGNLCRCTGYTKIIDAVLQAGRDIKVQRTRDPGGASP